jgi:SNF2 family DNA or RNA helicase
MDYQKEGLNWLYYMWYKGQSAILADEMGLGKTIQVIAFFATLIQDHGCWPFLVVVPNSTCPNWRREIKTWAPSLRVVTYYGTASARKIAHHYEMFPEGGSDLRCHVVITSYETMIDNTARRIFSTIPWAGLVVDEGQRLKNDKNQLYETLTKICFPFKILLTGTPLQNNVRELFNLIQFCDPSKDAEILEDKYQTLTKENVSELHQMIRPFFLRRTKAQVLTFLPPMAQIIVPVTMSVVQKKLYKSILARNPQLIKAIFKRSGCSALKQSERHNLNNVLMQLRKCLCHPFVYSKAIEERGVNAVLSHRNLVEASSKLQLLEMLLPKLQERGHRVLIFSQFLDNLDVVEDFLDGLGLLHRRLDGSMTSLEKQKQIDEFNAPDSPYFAFLLSTRSGGVGINLATADTVIIMDPDFNPHQDIQALSRAHRIGQQRKVLVFQLMTRGSAEEKIMQIGKKKMALDHVLIDCMDTENDAGLDLESILRHGTKALFDDDNTGDIQYDAEAVEKLLDRSQVENTKTGDDASAESQFSFARVWVNESNALEDQLEDSEAATPNNNVWDKILQERERAAAEEAKAKAETLGRGKRRRQVKLIIRFKVKLTMLTGAGHRLYIPVFRRR